MKAIVLFVATSLIVSTMLAIIPNLVFADPPTSRWCFQDVEFCFDTKKECKSAAGDAKCHKVSVKVPH